MWGTRSGMTGAVPPPFKPLTPTVTPALRKKHKTSLPGAWLNWGSY